MATLYFTAQIAHFTINAWPFKQKNFIYFIQDFEPIFFPHDSRYIEALESYRFPHFPIYSTPFLSRWFKHEKIGQYQFLPTHLIEMSSFSSQPAIKKWELIKEGDFSVGQRTRTLIAYARSHADR